MSTNNTRPKDLRSVMVTWLLRKLVQAESLKDRSLEVYRSDRSDYSREQYRYAKHLVASIKWLISNVPKKFARYDVPNIPDNCDESEITSDMLRMLDQCPL